ncbi:hypothetical protein GCM10022226_07970 [Sphaerisporangium flaviroseum]|uniref:D,D-heptose 1,7-bisphosphate phosphatase n=1 Tax=Sphaerisporangium flaviroseum TaxID=509199 RepID=A0ABP7HGH0_9ACTN
MPSTRHVPAAVLFDRDGTLIENVSYDAEDGPGVAVPGARKALDRLRRAGVPIGVVVESGAGVAGGLIGGVGGVGDRPGRAGGLIGPAAYDDVNARVEELLGPFDVWAVCPHDETDGCRCRKPAPGLILHVAHTLGVDPGGCVVVGDTGSDMEAARAAGARGILVPTARTLPAEVTAAWEVAADLDLAVEMMLSGWCEECAPLGSFGS